MNYLVQIKTSLIPKKKASRKSSAPRIDAIAWQDVEIQLPDTLDYESVLQIVSDSLSKMADPPQLVRIICPCMGGVKLLCRTYDLQPAYQLVAKEPIQQAPESSESIIDEEEEEEDW